MGQLILYASTQWTPQKQSFLGIHSSNTGALSTSFLIGSHSTIRLLLPEIEKEKREILILFSSLLLMLGTISPLHVQTRQFSTTMGFMQATHKASVFS